MTADGKVLWVEIPADDFERSPHSYQPVTGRCTRERVEGARVFADATAGVSGAARINRPAPDAAGIVVSGNVENVADSVETATDAGGRLADGIGRDPGAVTAWLRDPCVNPPPPGQEPNA